MAKPAEVTKIKFLKSPTGQYHLAYSVGDVVELNNELAAILVGDGFAELVSLKAPATTQE